MEVMISVSVNGVKTSVCSVVEDGVTSELVSKLEGVFSEVLDEVDDGVVISEPEEVFSELVERVFSEGVISELAIGVLSDGVLPELTEEVLSKVVFSELAGGVLCDGELSELIDGVLSGVFSELVEGVLTEGVLSGLDDEMFSLLVAFPLPVLSEGFEGVVEEVEEVSSEAVAKVCSMLATWIRMIDESVYLSLPEVEVPRCVLRVGLCR